MECQGPRGGGKEPMKGEWPGRRNQQSKENIPAERWSRVVKTMKQGKENVPVQKRKVFMHGVAWHGISKPNQRKEHVQQWPAVRCSPRRMSGVFTQRDKLVWRIKFQSRGESCLSGEDANLGDLLFTERLIK